MRLTLYLQVYLLRAIVRLSSWLDFFFNAPSPLKPAFTATLPAKLSQRPGKISLYFYLPRGYTRSTLAKKELPVIVNFFGGGFVIGHPTDDARWATTLVDNVDAVFVSVGYRRGPEHPQPTAVEDCVDALRWLWAHAEEYGIDSSRTIITGFSAGGNLCFTTPLRHYRETKNQSSVSQTKASGGDDYSGERAEDVTHNGKVAGIVAFYPSVNQATSRQQKSDSNPISKTKGKEPSWLHRIIDESYYQNLPLEGRASLNLSPALAPKTALVNALPEKVAIFTCEWDKLLVEAEDFRKELKSLGKTVGGRMIERVGHAFDRKSKYVAERDEMYREAVDQIKSMT